MRVLIKYLGCGGMGSIIECSYGRPLCYFCKEYNSWYWEEKDVTPKELIALLNRFDCIIILKPTRPK